METSAKNSINVDQAFISLAQDIKKRLIDTDTGNKENKSDDRVKLDGEKKETKEGCAC